MKPFPLLALLFPTLARTQALEPVGGLVTSLVHSLMAVVFYSIPLGGDGDVSCEEVVQSHLARLDEVNPQLNAVVVPLHEQALAQARELNRQRGRLDTLPPLFGVPVTTKINMDLAGQVNSDSVPAYQHDIATEDAPVIANLKHDGAIILGLTNTPEFSIRWFTSNPLHGTSFTPWDAGRTPGGSSGAAAAVAAGHPSPSYCRCRVLSPARGRCASGAGQHVPLQRL